MINEATDRRDEILQMLGHELRNPLAAIRSSILAARLGGETQDQALEIAERQVDQLARLIDGLLDVAMLRQGSIGLHRSTLDLADLVRSIVAALRSQIEQRGIRLALELPAVPVLIEADRARLGQALEHLLVNASEYTEPGGSIDVSVELRGSEVRLGVRDSGPGIDGELLPHVFDPFCPGESSLERPNLGLGIGLTVVRELAELHGGRIEAHSDGRGEGSEFSLWLPRLADAQPEPVARRPRRAPVQRPRILLVEDNADVADGLSMLLGLQGYHVLVARDGLAGLEAAGRHRPDVMLVDIGLPKMDGYELARRVRAQAEICDTQLVAITGYGTEQDHQRALDSGFDAHLVKPVRLETLEPLLAERAKPPRTASAQNGSSARR